MRVLNTYLGDMFLAKKQEKKNKTKQNETKEIKRKEKKRKKNIKIHTT